jgi:hypothetical protein
MTELDDDLVPDVAELHSELGTDFIFNVPASATHTAATGAVALGTITTYTVKGSPPTRVQSFTPDASRQERIKTTIAAQGLAFTPDRGMSVTYGGWTWIIELVSPVPSGDSLCAYDLELVR